MRERKEGVETRERERKKGGEREREKEGREGEKERKKGVREHILVREHITYIRKPDR